MNLQHLSTLLITILDQPMVSKVMLLKREVPFQGVDFLEMFAPTPRMESLRILVQFSVQNNLLLHQMDVKSAYLHAPLNEEIYVKQPLGYEEVNANEKNSCLETSKITLWS